MKIKMFFFVFAGVCLAILTACKTQSSGDITTESTTYNCAADKTWFANPSMPTEVKKSIKKGMSSNFCDFYQFSWQAFAYMTAASNNDPTILNFEDSNQFRVLEANSDGSPVNSCDDDIGPNILFIRTSKPKASDTQFVIPERINQAGSSSTIYDQLGNVVYYNVRFSKNMCDVKSIAQANNFPGGTTELKTAWKVLSKNDDVDSYITMSAEIGTDSAATTLGLIGMHMALATPDHPEFVWATFEHNSNVPDCNNPSSTKGWSFASEACTSNLMQPDPLGIVQCDFNRPSAQTNLSLTSKQPPTEICREYPYGSALGDPHYTENVESITSLNNNVQPYLTGAHSVLKNYFNLGALWVSDTTQSSVLSNQRGSLRLANSVAETDFQSVDFNTKTNNKFVSNCFGCHNYTGTETAKLAKNTTSGQLSHIFDDITVGAKQCVDVQSKHIINSQSQAATDCKKACAHSSKMFNWNGQWTNQDSATGQQLATTICGCCPIEQQSAMQSKM